MKKIIYTLSFLILTFTTKAQVIDTIPVKIPQIDTAGRFVNDVVRKNDTTLTIYKGSAATDISLRFSSSGSSSSGDSIISFAKNLTKDSAILTLKDGRRFAVKDSIGSLALPSLSILTDAATITWDYNTQSTEAKVTLGGNRTLSITNLPSGKVVYLTLGVIQDATGNRTLALPASTKVINGGSGAVTLSTTSNATDILSFRWNGTTLYCTYGKNYN